MFRNLHHSMSLKLLRFGLDKFVYVYHLPSPGPRSGRRESPSSPPWLKSQRSGAANLALPRPFHHHTHQVQKRATHQRRHLPEPRVGGAQDLSRWRDQTVASRRADYRHEEPGISNSEIRQITHLDRHQVVRLMNELKSENPGKIELVGKGRGAHYVYHK